MNRKVLLLSLLLLAPLVQAGEADTQRAAQWMEAHREHTPMLRNFLERMPKGADLHSHISGAVYAETYLKLAADGGWCVDSANLAFAAPPCGNGTVPALGLPTATYSAMVDKMSVRNYEVSGRTGHDQFFATFGSFGPISGLPTSFVPMLAEVTNRAAGEHIQYLELMTTYQSWAVKNLAKQLPWASEPDMEPDMAKRRQWLLDNGLPALVEAGRQDMYTLDADYARAQGCGTPAAMPGCGVTVRWLQQTTRTGSPESVFAQLTYAFELAKADSRLVGVQLVAPEDDPVALRDYRLQMEMIGFLAKQSPQVKIALHAGELTLGLVPPSDLHNHIHDAVLVAGANRVGHAVDIGFEDDAAGTMAAMREKHVAAEICLTSNDVILGVKGKNHPLPDYLAASVPVVFASDDEGVSRIDLSNEYVRAAQTYNLGYRQLKHIARNSLEYSFLPGASLWCDEVLAKPTAACAQDEFGEKPLSPTCRTFLAGSEKAAAEEKLEAAFEDFEQQVERKDHR
jgi:adenosine deaminase/adenosine deaminase CECR1